jgi:ABC-2 type transport system permease protein
MFATWKYTLRRLAVATFCWGAVLFSSAFLIVFSFDYMIEKNKELLVDLINNMPAPLKAMVGDANQFATPQGFLDAKFFVQSGLLLGIYGVFAGSGLLATDEEKGRLDLLAAYPVSRRSLFWGRTLAVITSMAVVVFFAWLGLVASLPLTSLDISKFQFGLGCVTLFALTMVYTGMALLLSLLLPSRLVVAGTAGVLLFSGFLLALLAPAIDFLRPVHALLPFRYYQGGKAMDEFDVVSLLVLLSLTTVELLAAWWLFERREIRVIGEGVFRWKRGLFRLGLCVLAYAAIVGPAVAWKGWDSPKTSPTDIKNALPDSLQQILPNR